MQEIRLGVGHSGPGSGHVALVDDAKYALVSPYQWHAHKARKNAVVYARRTWEVEGRQHHQYMHNLIMGVSGVDHADHDGLNNQCYNLRVADQARNSQNQRKAARKMTSRYKGVSWDRVNGKWQAHIQVNGRQRKLGRFLAEDGAARAYDAAARVAFGEFAWLNFPEREGSHAFEDAADLARWEADGGSWA